MIAGDNLDIYVKTSHLSKEKRHRDIHMFTSNIISSRVATVDMSNSAPKIDTNQLNCESFIMDELEKGKFLEAYSVLLARNLCKIPTFEQYRKLVPDHLLHEFSQKMSSKSVVYPMQIMMKNESKHEDCLAIMDSYEEQLIKLYSGAFGKFSYFCFDLLHLESAPPPPNKYIQSHTHTHFPRTFSTKTLAT